MTETEDAMDIAKAAIEEAKVLKEENEILKMENRELRNAVNDPTAAMKAQGWQRFVTPHADEAFDPLNRAIGEDTFSGPFEGSGDLIAKSVSRHDELREGEDAERELNRR